MEGEQSGFISDIMDSLNYAISNVLVLFGWGVLLFALGRPHLMIVAILSCSCLPQSKCIYLL